MSQLESRPCAPETRGHTRQARRLMTQAQLHHVRFPALSPLPPGILDTRFRHLGPGCMTKTSKRTRSLTSTCVFPLLQTGSHGQGSGPQDWPP